MRVTPSSASKKSALGPRCSALATVGRLRLKKSPVSIRSRASSTSETSFQKYRITTRHDPLGPLSRFPPVARRVARVATRATRATRDAPPFDIPPHQIYRIPRRSPHRARDASDHSIPFPQRPPVRARCFARGIARRARTSRSTPDHPIVSKRALFIQSPRAIAHAHADVSQASRRVTVARACLCAPRARSRASRPLTARSRPRARGGPSTSHDSEITHEIFKRSRVAGGNISRAIAYSIEIETRRRARSRIPSRSRPVDARDRVFHGDRDPSTRARARFPARASERDRARWTARTRASYSTGQTSNRRRR